MHKHLPFKKTLKKISAFQLFFLVLALTVSLIPHGNSILPAAEAATYTAGVTTVGPIMDSGNNNGISSTQVITGGTGGTLSSIKVRVGNVNASPKNHMRVAIYADNGSDLPGTRLGVSNSKVLTANSWNTFSLTTTVALSPNTKYWLAFNVDGANTQYALENFAGAKSGWKIPTSYGTWPNPMGSLSEPIGAERYSIYMTYTAPDPTATPTPTVTPTPTPSCISVNPSTDIQAAVDATSPGATFCFSAGTYTNISSIAPKSGQTFDGQNKIAILDGGNTRQYAFRSTTASNVTIKGFVIKNYNTPLQDGAISSFGTSGWTIENNNITQNAASGVATDTGVRVLSNTITNNGQQGFAAHGDNILYENNEIAYNNANLAIDPTWEAGGGKAWDTRYATFRNNHVHHNGGNGLWDDTNNIYITYDSNNVHDNWGAGIYHEIGYDAMITNNTVTNNGTSTSQGGGQNLGWLWNAGIQLRSSGATTSASPIIISGNTVTNNYNGISLIESPAQGCTNTSLGEGKYGPCKVQNVIVQNNTITMSQGATGAVQDGAGNGIFTTQNNRFIGNTYHVNNLIHQDDGYTYGWFAWTNSWYDWAGWQSFNNDTTGSFGL